MKCVILAGGSGTRLWPLSRQKKPKQLQSLVSEKTLLQETIDRLDFLSPEDIYIATNSEYANEIIKQAHKISKENIIIEPAMRDTATCICYSAFYLAEKFPDEVMAIIYADHLIQDKEEFVEKLKIAEKLAREEKTLNIIEVKAKFPNTNLGYVKIGNMLKVINGHEIYEFLEFKEKPDSETAKKYLDSYQYLWNTGYYVWSIEEILKQYKKFLPDTYNKLKEIFDNWNSPQREQLISTNYSSCEKISVDYAIMEKVEKEKVRIIPANLGWSDIGTWDAIYEELQKDSDQNLTKGNSINIDTKKSLIYNYTDKLITTSNVEDLIIVATDDSILVIKRDNGQEVKKIVERLKKENMNNLL